MSSEAADTPLADAVTSSEMSVTQLRRMIFDVMRAAGHQKGQMSTINRAAYALKIPNEILHRIMYSRKAAAEELLREHPMLVKRLLARASSILDQSEELDQPDEEGSREDRPPTATTAGDDEIEYADDEGDIIDGDFEEDTYEETEKVEKRKGRPSARRRATAKKSKSKTSRKVKAPEPADDVPDDVPEASARKNAWASLDPGAQTEMLQWLDRALHDAGFRCIIVVNVLSDLQHTYWRGPDDKVIMIEQTHNDGPRIVDLPARSI